MFVWTDRKGKVRYDVHGVEDHLVSNRKTRNEIEADMIGCFLYDRDENPEKEQGRLYWMQMELEVTHNIPTWIRGPKLNPTKKLMPQETE